MSLTVSTKWSRESSFIIACVTFKEWMRHSKWMEITLAADSSSSHTTLYADEVS